MQVGNVIGVAAFGAGCFYAGFRYNDWMRKRRALKLYEATVEVLKDDYKLLKSTIEKSSAEVKKRSKEAYDDISRRFNDSLHRPELLDALRKDIDELLRSLHV